MTSRQLLTATLAMTALALAGCGGEEPLPEQDVRGMVLPDAQKELEAVGIRTQVHSDGLLGVIVPEHWIVCDQEQISDHLIRLEVSKNACD